MPELSEIAYSREECVAVVRDYYLFLTSMYLDETAILEPPEGGWPSITYDIMHELGKTDGVTSLLRHLPYIRRSDNAGNAFGGYEAIPFGCFADWQSYCALVSEYPSEAKALKVTSEGYFSENIPPHVIGITAVEGDDTILLLDTELGVVYWPECPFDIRLDTDRPREQISDDPYEYAVENEAEWRAEGASWAIADFFEILKDQFRRLLFLPLNPRSVVDVYATLAHGSDGLTSRLQEIYRAHGWPNLESYDKKKCLEAIQSALKEDFPNYADEHNDQEEN